MVKKESVTITPYKEATIMAYASVSALMLTIPSEAVDSLKFRTVLEDHLDYFRKSDKTQVVHVTHHQLEVYRFDWLGLIRACRVSPQVRWLTIRLNGGESYTDVPSEPFDLLVPDISEVDRLMSMHNSAKKI